VNLGIAGRRAIVCASSAGLGRACAEALRAEGVAVVINGRDPDRPAQTAAELGTASVCADVTTAEGRAALLAACPTPDILITNNGGPRPQPFAEAEHNDWLAALEANMLAPLMLIRAVLPAMRAQRFGRIVNITSAMVTTPRPHMVLSSGARAGLTAAVKGISLDCARDNVVINNLLPERLDTDRQHQMALAGAEREGITYEEARRRQIAGVPAGRLGDPREFAAMCLMLCGHQTGFVSGQNLHVDGGAYPALI
jgi:3-oxoacyl-[acyl-carrier protein] reductase